MSPYRFHVTGEEFGRVPCCPMRRKPRLRCKELDCPTGAGETRHRTSKKLRLPRGGQSPISSVLEPEISRYWQRRGRLPHLRPAPDSRQGCQQQSATAPGVHFRVATSNEKTNTGATGTIGVDFCGIDESRCARPQSQGHYPAQLASARNKNRHAPRVPSCPCRSLPQ